MESTTESMLKSHANNIQLQTISRSPRHLNHAHLVKVPAIRSQGITRMASSIQRPHAPAHTYAAVVGNATATRGKTHDLKAPLEQHRAGTRVSCLYNVYVSNTNSHTEKHPRPSPTRQDLLQPAQTLMSLRSHHETAEPGNSARDLLQLAHTLASLKPSQADTSSPALQAQWDYPDGLDAESSSPLVAPSSPILHNFPPPDTGNRLTLKRPLPVNTYVTERANENCESIAEKLGLDATELLELNKKRYRAFKTTKTQLMPGTTILLPYEFPSFTTAAVPPRQRLRKKSLR